MNCKSPRPYVSLVLCGLAAFFVGAADAQDAPPQELPLPLKRVVMFSSSVGFFEHQGEIEGDRQIEFAFKTSDINDLLKSLVVQDRGGGLVTAVNYGSPEPIARTLRTLAIDLTQSPTLAEIFQQLRGQMVHLEAPDAIEGVIVGVETRKLPVGDKEIEVQVLNLRTDKGLRSVRLDGILLTRLVNPKIDGEFQQALELLASEQTSDQKRVKLDFRGAGKRQVSVGYIQEAPVWKTSYRLVLADKEPPFLQGWAIVENTTSHDWSQVQLTLVSGRPISFVMDLYEPLFMARPLVVPEQHASLRPRVYDQDLAGRAQEFQAAGNVVRSRKRGGAMGMGGMMGGGMGGGGFGGGGMGGGATAGYGEAGDPFAAPASIDLKQGVASAASAGDVGELFRYVIKQPVTLGRNQSAMLPIVNDAVKGEKVAIFNPAVHPKHPLAGLRLTNTTPLHLSQGPITLFDGGEYAGDARIEDIPPGSTRLVSYALDLETEVAIEDQPPVQVTVALAIRKGGLHVKHKVTRQAHYVVKNSSDRAKQVLLERPIDPAWKLVQPAAVETTRALHRLSIQAEPGKTSTTIAVEERELAEEFVLATLDLAQLNFYLRVPAATPALKQALQEALDRKTAAASALANRAAVEARLSELAAEQQRVRANLQAVPAIKSDDPADENHKASRELTKRYLDKLASLESELEMQRQQLVKLRQQEQQANQQLEDLLESLAVE
ncbi:MAG: hypothetical protein WD872_19405 [Pirellulaceae bacterium]